MVRKLRARTFAFRRVPEISVLTGRSDGPRSITRMPRISPRLSERNAISISFVATSEDMSKNNLDQLDPIFMYSQILKEILLTIKFSDEHIKQYTDYCRDVFAKTDTELNKINKLQTEYNTRTPIWWYTFETF